MFCFAMFSAVLVGQTSQAPGTASTLSLGPASTGSGTVTSSPSFASGTSVKLTAAPDTGESFAEWSGASNGRSACTVTMTCNLNPTATVNVSLGVKALNHIIFMLQENRGFDHYFGAMRQYWRNHKFADISFDGLPQFNPTSGNAPLYGPPPTNPGCDPAYAPPDDCMEDSTSPEVASYHLITQCIENPSPSWDEGHVDWNRKNPLSATPTLDGYVYTGAHDARNNNPPFYDTDGVRVMGYYDDTDLNYYYYMASQFATSDRWFAPAMTRTQPNRDYLLAGTSQGYAYPIGTDSKDQALLTAKTIFQALQNAGISWKIYVDPASTPCVSDPTAQCLLGYSYIQDFQWGLTIPQSYPNNLVPISEYFSDVKNGTLPQVALIEPASPAGLDEHGSDSDQYPINIQLGAQYVESLINALMTSVSWKDSAFILTYDEGGGLYDHVAARPAKSPDGIKPMDLLPGDICSGATGPTCDFTYTGYRVPVIVISPFARKHYVNHQVADYTAILKLIETRFNLPALTKRDAAQMNMTAFFNFNTPAWMTPPKPPAQSISGPCYLNQLP